VSKAKREFDDDEEWVPDASHAPVLPQTGKQKLAVAGAGNGRALPPGVAEGIEVKTKFPVARIKRIMQADEDVGKVAQVTPVVVCKSHPAPITHTQHHSSLTFYRAIAKALELFMISLVTKSAQEAKTRGSTRVGAAHLKQAVVTDKQIDFLTEIVSKVPDAAPAQGKHEGDHSDEAETGAKKKGRARRKKKEDDDM